jgi:hypothetical protein
MGLEVAGYGRTQLAWTSVRVSDKVASASTSADAEPRIAAPTHGRISASSASSGAASRKLALPCDRMQRAAMHVRGRREGGHEL